MQSGLYNSVVFFQGTQAGFRNAPIMQTLMQETAGEAPLMQF